MRKLFNSFPTVEEETWNVEKYFQLFSYDRLFKKLTIAFALTTIISTFAYFTIFYGVYKFLTFSILCALFTMILFILILSCWIATSYIVERSYQIPGTKKVFFNVSLNDICDLIEDDIKIHENVEENVSSDEAFSEMEKFRFNFICNIHFNTWRELNETLYSELVNSNPTKDEIETLKEQQELFKIKFLKAFNKIPEFCEEVVKWYEKFEKTIEFKDAF